jgi:hypothetical protein
MLQRKDLQADDRAGCAALAGNDRKQVNPL